MAVIEQALYTLMAADNTIAATVGARIYPVVVPQDADLPALVYQRISSVRDHTHDATTGLAHPRIQVTAIATTYNAAKTLANAVRTLLDNYKGPTSDGVVIDAILFQNEMDVFNLAGDQRLNTFGVMVDFVVWHHE